MSLGRFLVLVTLVTLAALAAGTGEGVAHAARLSYEAPGRCPSRARFAEEVTARLGFSPWSESGPAVRVRISNDRAGFVGSLAPDADASAAERRFVADSCRKVTDLLVTAAAMALDRRESAASAPASGAPPASGSEPKARREVARREVARRDATPPPARAGNATRQTAPGGMVIPPDSPAAKWSFAERNNHFQLGLIFVSAAGAGVTGNIPVGKGHVQATYARTTTDSDFGSGANAQVHAYYLYPVFYINESSSFEVPIFAGGGFGYQMYTFDQDMGTDINKTAILPTLAGGMALQFRAFPVEFLSQMAVSLVKTPLDGSYMSFNFAIRYVFGRD
jgi:hypothetical protein